MTEREDCYACRGTGIGLFGDPDTSRCTRCGGRGYLVDDDDADLQYEIWRERMLEAADDERKRRKESGDGR